MLQRRVFETIQTWRKEAAGSRALLLEGARRVGKTTLAMHAGETLYRSYVLIDFSKTTPEFRGAFIENLADLDALFLLISATYNVRLYPRESLIIFDEVQFFPQARQAIKQLVADGRFDYIETGSLISIRRNTEGILLPSEERSVSVHPFDFPEYLDAVDESMLGEAIESAMVERKPLPEPLHRQALRRMREYLIIGGMPQAINAFLQTKDIGVVDEVKRDILKLYRDDITKFGQQDTGKIHAIFDTIPGQLAKHERRFTLAALGEAARYREYENALFWLGDSHIVNLCFNATDPAVNLAASLESNTFKAYLADTGLLFTHTFASHPTTPHEIYRDVLLGKLGLNLGMYVENMVAAQLRARGYQLFFYSRYARQASERMEIDFLIAKEYDDAAGRLRISPLEVKSSKRYSTVSLEKFRHKFGKRIGTEYVLHPKQLEVVGQRVYLPLYMAPYL